MTLRRSQKETLRIVCKWSQPSDGAMATDIAYSLGVSVGAAEKRLERLAARGLIEDKQFRWPHGRSGWITLAVITDAGREAL